MRRSIHFESRAEAAERLEVERQRQEAKGPDLSAEACACGRFGPWNDGTAFYCEAHVPPQLRFAAQFFAETMES